MCHALLILSRKNLNPQFLLILAALFKKPFCQSSKHPYLLVNTPYTRITEVRGNHSDDGRSVGKGSCLRTEMKIYFARKILQSEMPVVALQNVSYYGKEIGQACFEPYFIR
jgi:hypothetical protein